MVFLLEEESEQYKKNGSVESFGVPYGFEIGC
jgi:hypothetical protein